MRGTDEGGHRRAPRAGTDHRHPVASCTRAYGGPAARPAGTRTLSRCRPAITADPPARPLPTRASGAEVVLIPVKAFHQAKRRLDRVLTDAEREQLVRTMAATRGGRLCPAAGRRGVRRRRSGRLGRRPRAPPSCGSPARGSTARCGRASSSWRPPAPDWVTVAHGDLPRARDLGTLAPFDGVTLVPDRRDDGTNVLRLPGGLRFPLRLRTGLVPRPPRRGHAPRPGRAVVRDPDLAYDVDWPADVAELGPPRRLDRRATGGPKAPGLTRSKRNGV